MKNEHRALAALILLLGSLQLTACRQSATVTAEAAADEGGPAKVEHLQGAEPARVTLTAEAVKRLDIQTSIVREAEVDGALQKVIPYAAVLYDTEGDTWTYTSPVPQVFVRHHIIVDHIVGDQAVLSDGPPAGAAVVTVGAAELYGAENEFEEE